MKSVTPRTLEIVKISLLGGLTIGYCGIYHEYFFKNRKLQLENELLRLKLDNYERHTKH